MATIPEAPFFDEMLRPDESPIVGPWEALVGLTKPDLVSHLMQITGGDGLWRGIYNQMNFGTKQEIGITVATKYDGHPLYFKTRMQKASAPGTFPIPDSAGENSYNLVIGEFNPNEWDIKRKDNGTDTSIAIAPVTQVLADGDRIRFESVGALHIGEYSAFGSATWTNVITAIDPTYAFGAVGFVMEGGSWQVGNFRLSGTPFNRPLDFSQFSHPSMRY